MTFGSLFTGIGGIDLGLEWAGMQCKWQVENDRYATRVLERHWPDVRRHGDVREFLASDTDGESVREQQGRSGWSDGEGSAFCRLARQEWGVDLIAGGFPCQPVSVAGEQRCESDERWLWPEFNRIVRILRPRWVLIENVAGLLSADAGRVFRVVLRDLAEGGYDAEWDVVPAAAVGAPHLRKRLFIVAYCPCVGRRQRCSEHATREREPATASSRGDVADSIITGLPSSEQPIVFRARREDEGRAVAERHWRRAQPDVRGSNDGIPSWVDGVDPLCPKGVTDRINRIKCLGNAVVPQVAEWIGSKIVNEEARA